MTIIGGDGPPPSPEQFLAIDEQLADDGIPALERPFQAAKIWGEQSGDIMTALKQEGWFRERYRELHPSVPYDGSAFLTLCVSARSISYFLKPPMGYGRVAIKPLDYITITKPEVERLWATHPSAFWELTFQGFDGVDLFMAQVNYHSKIKAVENMLATAVIQLTASARQLVAGEIDLSIPQGLAMACELVGKSVLLKEGATQKEIKALGHDLTELAKAVADRLSSPVDDQVQMVAETLPKYVAVRYDAPALNMAQAQDVYRRTLFVVADFLRRTNHDQLYWKIIDDKTVPKRNWETFL